VFDFQKIISSYISLFPFSCLLNIFIFFYYYCILFYVMFSVLFLPSLSQTLPSDLKNHALLPYTERGAAGLISRLVECVRVTRLFAPSAHFVNIFVAYRLALFFAYRLALFVTYRLALLVAYRLVSIASSSPSCIILLVSSL